MRSRLRVAHVQLPPWYPEGMAVLESGSHQLAAALSFQWMMADGMDEDEMAAVFTVAVVLYQTTPAAVTFGECLDTALTWDRG